MKFYFGFWGWLIYIALCILYNFIEKIKKKKRPVYLASNIWRTYAGLSFLILMSSDDGFDGFDPAYPRTIIPYIPNVIYFMSSFYLFFDAGLNGLRKLAWDYRGSDSGWLDSMKIAFYHVLKGLCFIATVWSIIMLWRR